MKEIDTIRRLLTQATVAVVTFAAVAATAVGCGEAVDEPEPGDVVIMVSGTATDRAPELPSRFRDALRAAAKRPAPDGHGQGAMVTIRAADGRTVTRIEVTPRRRTTGETEHGRSRDKLIDNNLKRVEDAMRRTRATDPELDLLQALYDGARGVDPARLIVISHGLSTRGGIDLRDVGWNADPEKVADELATRNLLPNLDGWEVWFVGLGDAAGAQTSLPPPNRRRLSQLWLTVCRRAGGTCTVADEPLPGSTAVATTAQMSTVDVPGVPSVVGPAGEVKTSVSDRVLGFGGDSAIISPDGQAFLYDLATRIRARRNQNTPVRVTGWCADPPSSTEQGLAELSRARAHAVKHVLREAGVGGEIRDSGGGKAPGHSAIQNGQFDERRAQQMRYVEIIY